MRAMLANPGTVGERPFQLVHRLIDRRFRLCTVGMHDMIRTFAFCGGTGRKKGVLECGVCRFTLMRTRCTRG